MRAAAHREITATDSSYRLQYTQERYRLQVVWFASDIGVTIRPHQYDDFCEELQSVHIEMRWTRKTHQYMVYLPDSRLAATGSMQTSANRD